MRRAGDNCRLPIPGAMRAGFGRLGVIGNLKRQRTLFDAF